MKEILIEEARTSVSIDISLNFFSLYFSFFVELEPSYSLVLLDLNGVVNGFSSFHYSSYSFFISSDAALLAYWNFDLASVLLYLCE